jgi:hypothetical protein
MSSCLIRSTLKRSILPWIVVSNSSSEAQGVCLLHVTPSKYGDSNGDRRSHDERLGDPTIRCSHALSQRQGNLHFPTCVPGRACQVGVILPVPTQFVVER